MPQPRSLPDLQQTIVACRKCPRLVAWTRKIAQEKRKAFQEDTYWGKPVPSFGDPKAEILIVGLAPAAHGANRTGRMFTGDRSGQWLYRALHRAGLANQPSFERADDGLKLINTWITAMVHCAPPQNKPTAEEKTNCLPYFHQELTLLPNIKVMIALGQIGWDGIYKTLKANPVLASDKAPAKKPKFGHGASYNFGPYHIVGSYHPSQQNTFTGRLTQDMFDAVFTQAQQATAS
jgi:uracil-DNA glycosylase family 4